MTTFALRKISIATMADWFGNTLRSVLRIEKQRRHRRESVRHLRALSDHHLKDLGIHRSEINSVVYQGDAGRMRNYGL